MRILNLACLPRFSTSILIAIGLSIPATSNAWTSRSQRGSKSVPTTVVWTTSGTWVVPAGFPTGKNTLECVGAGGGGGNGTASIGSAGGGGGAYAKLINLNLTAGTTLKYVIGAGGAANTDGGLTYVCNSTSNCASDVDTAVILRAGPGTAGSNGGYGGSSSYSLGAITIQGGYGSSGGGSGGGGGGGAASSLGGGGYGSDYVRAALGGGGGGGGGSGGGAAGFANSLTNNGGAGGANNSGTGAGTAGAGVGGAGSAGGGGGGGASTFNGGAGSGSLDLNGTIGSGGGGGGAGSGSGKVGGAGGAYGGGGGAGGINGGGGVGGAAVCVLKYGGDTGETGGTISAVQQNQFSVSANTTSFSTGTWGKLPTAGNLVVCWLEYNMVSAGYTISGVSDTAGNSYTRVVGPYQNASMIGGAYWEEVWYAKNVSPGTSGTFTVTATQTAAYNSDKHLSCVEYKGADPINPFIGMSTASGNSTTITLPTVNITQAPALVVVGGGNGGGNQQVPIGYDKRSTINGSMLAHFVQRSTGAYGATWKIDATAQWQSWMVVFKSR